MRYGYLPTVREIGAHFGFLWPAARRHIQSLAKKGFIRITPTKSRGIEILWHDESKEFVIPVVGRIKAGGPELVVEEIDAHIRIDGTLFHGVNLFSLRVVGDSMSEAGILDGDYVIVRQQNSLEHRDIGVVIVGDEATVKRVLFEKERVILKPENKNMEPVSYKPGDIIIAGKVVGLIRNRI